MTVKNQKKKQWKAFHYTEDTMKSLWLAEKVYRPLLDMDKHRFNWNVAWSGSMSGATINEKLAKC